MLDEHCSQPFQAPERDQPRLRGAASPVEADLLLLHKGYAEVSFARGFYDRYPVRTQLEQEIFSG